MQNVGDNSLGPSFNCALRRPVLSSAEESRLARRAAQGDRDARDRLVEGNVRVVTAVARGYRGRGVAYADLVQEGMLGLMRGLERFDPERRIRLATYASWWIRRAMLNAIVAAPSIRLPAQARRELAAILRAEHELSGGSRPDARTLAARAGVAVARVERLRDAAHVVTSLESAIGESETALAELVADPALPALTATLDRHDTAGEVATAMARLAPRTRTVIELHYGLSGDEPLTHEQVGRKLGLTAERCRQIEAEGLRRLRALAERWVAAA